MQRQSMLGCIIIFVKRNIHFSINKIELHHLCKKKNIYPYGKIKKIILN